MKPDYIYFQLILKELDTVQEIIKNLDNLIQNSKNFSLAFWGGDLYLIVQHLDGISSAIEASGLEANQAN